MNNKCSNNVCMSFLGDISLNDDYVKLYLDKQDPFSEINDHLSAKDYVVGNLECMGEGDEGENLYKKPRLKTTIKTLCFLKSMNLGLITLAHNHVYDNLIDGFNKTINFLNKNTIDHMGASIYKDEEKKPHIITINGVKFCFLNYVTKDTNPKIPQYAKIYLNYFNKADIISITKRERVNVDHIILLLHWGGEHEGGFCPDWYQLNDSKEFIDAGVDLIVGHHSHTLQPYEVYKGKYIFYSLGNFCFADIPAYNYEVNRNRGVKSIILNVTFDRNSYKIDMLPIENINSYIKVNKKILVEYNKRQYLFKIIKNVKLVWIINHYYHKYIFPAYYYFFGNNRKPIERIRMLKIEKIKYYFLRE